MFLQLVERQRYTYMNEDECPRNKRINEAVCDFLKNASWDNWTYAMDQYTLLVPTNNNLWVVALLLWRRDHEDDIELDLTDKMSLSCYIKEHTQLFL